MYVLPILFFDLLKIKGEQIIACHSFENVLPWKSDNQDTLVTEKLESDLIHHNGICQTDTGSSPHYLSINLGFELETSKTGGHCQFLIQTSSQISNWKGCILYSESPKLFSVFWFPTVKEVLKYHKQQTWIYTLLLPYYNYQWADFSISLTVSSVISNKLNWTPVLPVVQDTFH